MQPYEYVRRKVEFRYTDFTSSMIRELAQQLPAQYDEVAPLDTDEVGMYNNPEMRGVEADRLQMHIEGLECEYYFARVVEKGDESLRYYPEEEAGREVSRYVVATFSIKVPHQLPAMYIESRFNGRYRWKIDRRLPSQLKVVDLEGDFSRFFHVYVKDSQDARVAFEALAPNLMYDLLEKGREVDIEFAGNRIYFYQQMKFKKHVSNWAEISQIDSAVERAQKAEVSIETEITESEYRDTLMEYSRQVYRYAKVARQIQSRGDEAEPLYEQARWPRRQRLSKEGRIAVLVYGIPILLLFVSLAFYIMFSAVRTWPFPEVGSTEHMIFIVILLGFIAVLAIVALVIGRPRDIRYTMRMAFGDPGAARVRRRLLDRYGNRNFDDVNLAAKKH